MQGNLFDIEKGRQKRDEGIQTAIDHADRVNEDWSNKAYELLKKCLSNIPGEFMAEDVRGYAAMIDFPLPPHARAWGGVIAKAAKSGLIKRTGIGQVKNIKAHCANASIWILNKAS